MSLFKEGIYSDMHIDMTTCMHLPIEYKYSSTMGPSEMRNKQQQKQQQQQRQKECKRILNLFLGYTAQTLQNNCIYIFTISNRSPH